MRAVRVREFGSPEVLRIQDIPEPSVAAGQVLIAVELAGVIFGDLIVRSGRYPLPLPWQPGIEVGGRVQAVGPDVEQTLVGQRVVATTLDNRGGYAELALAEVANVYVLPDDLPLERAVPVFQAGAIATGVLAAMRFRAGESVLITAAAGRIGALLVQAAQAAGAGCVVGAASSRPKLDAVPADVRIDYSEPGWVREVQEATGGRGVDVVLDAIGGDVGTQAMQAAADGTGRIGVYGFASGSWLTVDMPDLVRRGLSVIGPLGITFAKPAAQQRVDAERALQAAAAGDLVPRIHATFPLADAASAHTELEQRRNIGAVLLRP